MSNSHSITTYEVEWEWSPLKYHGAPSDTLKQITTFSSAAAAFEFRNLCTGVLSHAEYSAEEENFLDTILAANGRLVSVGPVVEVETKRRTIT